MIDGKYEVIAKTPLGRKKGVLVLASEGNVCKATLTAARQTVHLVGSIDGNKGTFKGEVKLPFPFGKVGYVLTGTIEGDSLQGVCRTKKFSSEISGKRVS